MKREVQHELKLCFYYVSVYRFSVKVQEPLKADGCSEVLHEAQKNQVKSRKLCWKVTGKNLEVNRSRFLCLGKKLAEVCCTLQQFLKSRSPDETYKWNTNVMRMIVYKRNEYTFVRGIADPIINSDLV